MLIFLQFSVKIFWKHFVNRDKTFLAEKMYDDNIIASNSLTGNGEKAGPGPLLLKILVPAYAAGSIIGKSNNIQSSY